MYSEEQRVEVDIENQDIEDEFFEKIIKNVRGMLYFESKPVQLEKFKFSKVGFGLIIDFEPEQLIPEEYEKIKNSIIKQCKEVCEKRAKEIYEEHNKGRIDF